MTTLIDFDEEGGRIGRGGSASANDEMGYVYVHKLDSLKVTFVNSRRSKIEELSSGQLFEEWKMNLVASSDEVYGEERLLFIAVGKNILVRKIDKDGLLTIFKANLTASCPRPTTNDDNDDNSNGDDNEQDEEMEHIQSINAIRTGYWCGKEVLVSVDTFAQVKVWCCKTLKVMNSFFVEKSAWSIAFSGDKLIIGCNAHTITIIDADGKQTIQNDHQHNVPSIDANSKLIISASIDGTCSVRRIDEYQKDEEYLPLSINVESWCWSCKLIDGRDQVEGEHIFGQIGKSLRIHPENGREYEQLALEDSISEINRITEGMEIIEPGDDEWLNRFEVDDDDGFDFADADDYVYEDGFGFSDADADDADDVDDADDADDVDDPCEYYQDNQDIGTRFDHLGIPTDTGYKEEEEELPIVSLVDVDGWPESTLEEEQQQQQQQYEDEISDPDSNRLPLARHLYSRGSYRPYSPFDGMAYDGMDGEEVEVEGEYVSSTFEYVDELIALATAKGLFFIDAITGKILYIINSRDLPTSRIPHLRNNQFNRLCMMQWVSELSCLFVANQNGQLYILHLITSNSSINNQDGEKDKRVFKMDIIHIETMPNSPIAGFTVLSLGRSNIDDDDDDQYSTSRSCFVLYIIYMDGSYSVVNIERMFNCANLDLTRLSFT